MGRPFATLALLLALAAPASAAPARLVGRRVYHTCVPKKRR
jgi:hypothetical protein